MLNLIFIIVLGMLLVAVAGYFLYKGWQAFGVAFSNGSVSVEIKAIGYLVITVILVPMGTWMIVNVMH